MSTKVSYRFLIALLVWAGSAGQIQGAGFNSPGPPARVAGDLAAPADLDWLSEDWAPDDSAYQAAESQSRAAFKNPLRSSLLQQYEGEFEKSRQSLALFKYAVLRYMMLLPPIRGGAQQLIGLRQAFISVPSPHSRRYYRLRTLIEMRAWPRRSLMVAAKRLVQSDTNDIPVMVQAVYAGDMGDLGEQAWCLNVDRRLNRLAPGNLAVLACSGQMYFNIWCTKRAPSAARKSISYYRECLRLCKPGDPFRDYAARMVKFLSEHLHPN